MFTFVEQQFPLFHSNEMPGTVNVNNTSLSEQTVNWTIHSEFSVCRVAHCCQPELFHFNRLLSNRGDISPQSSVSLQTASDCQYFFL